MSETRLTFLACNRERVRGLINNPTSIKQNTNGTLTCIYLDNSRTVSGAWLLREFTQEGIAFDLVTRSMELGATQYLNAFCRYTPLGDPETGSYKDRDVMVDLRTLQSLVDTPDFLANHVKKKLKQFIPAPWFMQEQYEKIYRTRKLLGDFDTPEGS